MLVYLAFCPQNTGKRGLWDSKLMGLHFSTLESFSVFKMLCQISLDTCFCVFANNTDSKHSMHIDIERALSMQYDSLKQSEDFIWKLTASQLVKD